MSAPAPRRATALVALLGTLSLILLGGAASVSAHSAVRDTDPREGSVLRSAPREVTMTFTESVGITDDSLRVLSPENRRVNAGDTQHVPGHSDQVRVRLRDGLPDGTFTVAWRVVSADSHPIAGAFTFSIGEPSATTAAVSAEPAVNPASGALYDIARYAAYAAVALLIGVAVFVLACRPPSPEPLRGLVRAGWWILLATTVGLVFLRGPYERGTGPSTLLDPALIENTLTSRPGWALLARLALLAGAAVFLVRTGAGLRRAAERSPAVERSPAAEPSSTAERSPAAEPSSTAEPRRAGLAVVGGFLAVALAGTWAVAEHASAGIQVPVAMASSVLHLLAMAVWLGGLGALLTALHRSETPLPAASVHRFSRLAFTSVTVLVLTGVYQSWRGLGSWDAVFGTSYGRLLVAKVCGVVLLLAAAGFSRRWTARLTDAAQPSKTQPSKAPASKELVPALEMAEPRSEASSEPSSEGSAEGPSEGSAEAISTPAPAGSSGTGARHRFLRRSVLAEVVVGVAVLLITTVLTGTQPGRAELETAAAESAVAAADDPTTSTTLIPFDVGTPGGQGKVQLVLEPGRVGENTVEAVVIGPDGGIATVPEIRLSFTLRSQKIGPIDARLTDQGGYWGTRSLNLPLAGTWTMKVTIRTSDIDQVAETRQVKIAR
ncbi:copper resistance CopC/CopD family protein [Streptomyces aurantiacus]|uniref:copper resistance CopC/CopD family protein n=1 Tax=Streptomyces aurantiacus TaxID=47760 RepID=UPI001FDF28DD|nr:copper resistance protein CopC [Streptomyces aurantiacus]